MLIQEKEIHSNDLDQAVDTYHEVQDHVLVPIPVNALRELNNMLTTKSEKKYGFKLLYRFCLKHITDNSYTPFGAYLFWHSNEIRSFIGAGRDVAKKVFETMFESANHSKGRFPKSYKLKSEFLTGGYDLYRTDIVIKDPIPCFRINTFTITDEFENSVAFLQMLDMSNVHLRNPNLVADIQKRTTIEFNQQLRSKSKEGITYVQGYQLRGKQDFFMDPFPLENESFSSYKSLEIELLFQRTIFHMNKLSNYVSIQRDSTARRLHHNLTAVVNEYIPYISIEGELLSEVDMVNCHYTLFANILLGYRSEDFGILLNGSSTYRKVVEYINIDDTVQNPINYRVMKILQELGPEKHQFPLYMLAYKIQGMSAKFADLFVFIIAAIKGKLYEIIGMALFGEDYDSSKRNYVKSMLMNIFYRSYNQKGNSTKLFQSRFPNVYSLITDLKATMHRGFESGFIYQHDLFAGCINSQIKKDKSAYEAGNSCLAILLQNVESRIFVDKLLYPLQDMGFDLITKHDSILVKESDKDAVYEHIVEILNEELGENMYKLSSK